MEVVRGVVGNVDEDASLAAARDRHDSRGTLERVVLDDDERRRSRFRATTDAGRELGVVLGERTPRPGDVLLESADAMVVVGLASVPAAAVEVTADLDSATLVAFGHAVGNRHRPLATRDGVVYVALERGVAAESGDDLGAVDPRLEDVLPAGVEASVERVDPTLFDDGAAARVSSDDDAHDHTRDHDSHGHTHDHADH
jgi:urease accessory protein